MNRAEEKLDLLMKLGALFHPLQKLATSPEQYNSQETAEIIARYCVEHRVLMCSFEAYSKGQPGHSYAIQYERFTVALSEVQNQIGHGVDLNQILSKHLPIARRAIDDIPIPATSIIFEAGSPFTAYCRIRELCEADATESLVWLDPYMGPDIFYRYLSKARQTVPISLVTVEPAAKASKRDLSRWTEFIDISKLFASERGPSLYSLTVQTSLHDRWIIFDKKRIYSLGGSAKDAANKDYFTISKVDASQSNLQAIEDLIGSGTQFFGASTQQHR